MSASASKNSDVQEEDLSVNRVLEYYKKYSQNRNLPKYFTGSSVSYLPEVKCSDLREATLHDDREVVVSTNLDIVVTTFPDLEVDEKGKDNSSRGSSVMSNKKLEWDSGADIGYNNFQKSNQLLNRSLSLPLLSQINNNIDKCETAQNKGNIKLVIVNYDSSKSSSPATGNSPSSPSTPGSSESPKHATLSTATESKTTSTNKSCSTSNLSENNKISVLPTKFSQIKYKIGAPDAQSTPKYPESCRSDTELFTPHNKESVYTFSKKYSKSEKDSKLLTFKNSKKSNSQIKLKANKASHLRATKPILIECSSVSASKQLVNVGIQTEINTKSFNVNRVSDRNNQSVIYINNTKNKKPSADDVPITDSSATSRCSSFEYIKNTKTDDVTVEEHIIMPTVDEQKSEVNPRILDSRGSSNGSNIENLDPENLPNNFEKNIELLEKLLRSKRYDVKTKKRYIKKIIKKVSETTMLEDTSTSSDFFCRKQTKLTTKKPVKISSTDSSDFRPQKSWVDTNLPWYPASYSPKANIYRRKLETKTFSHEILTKSSSSSSTQPEIIPVDTRHSKTKQFTLTNNEFSVNHNLAHSSQSSTTNESTEKGDSTSSSKLCLDNWRDDKTTSEKLLESNTCSSNENYLDHIAKKERDYQLKWISNEISHLTKLRRMLEKDKLKRIHKSVYKVHLNNGEERNYVIETDLEALPSGHMDFKLNGKKYSVEEIDKCQKKTNVVGDIQVMAKENFTEIKVRTSCNSCKNSPCTCECLFCENSICTCKQEICHACKKTPCICSDASRSSHSGGTICLCCHKAKCVCENPKKDTQIGDSKTDRDYGLYIPVNNLSTYPPRSQRRSEFDLQQSKTACLSCKTTPCICVDKKTVTASELLRDYRDLQSTDLISRSNSLKKVFENCKCNSNDNCKCNFVEKLMKHFKIAPSTKSLENQQTVNTGNIPKNVQHFEMQTEYALQHKGIQVEETLKSISSQTSKTLLIEQNEVATQNKIPVNAPGQTETGNILKEYRMIKEDEPKRGPSNAASDVELLASQTYNNHNQDVIQNNGKKKNLQIENEAVTVNIETNTEEKGRKDTSSLTIPLNIKEVKGSKDASTSCSYAGLARRKIGKTGKTSGETGQKTNEDEITQSSKKDDGVAFFGNSSENPVSSSSGLPTNLTTSGSTESGVVFVRCICCKKQSPSQETVELQANNQTYNLCCQCVKRRPILTSMSYSTPHHTCNCYLSNQVPSSDRNKTEDDPYQQYCTCTKPYKVQNRGYCGHCRYKLKRTAKNSGGIAYTLTLENVSPNPARVKKKRKKPKLEVIKIRIPDASHKKKVKDRENYYRKDSCGTETEDKRSEHLLEGKQNEKEMQHTLQEYLNHNRPEFVAAAEERRTGVLSARERREENAEKSKLKFLEEKENHLPKRNYKLFTHREMKEITSRNYKKLPEVQKELICQRERRLRDADKAISDIFAKKIQNNVLKGRRNFPLDKNVVDLPN